MESREKILKSISENQPGNYHYPEIDISYTPPENLVEKFKAVLVSIGGAVIEVETIDQIKFNLSTLFPSARQIVSALPELPMETDITLSGNNPHQLKDIEVAVLKGHFAVAENGAIWLTQNEMPDRALPFICENLVLMVEKTYVIPTLHDAYEKIGDSGYEYGTFIAGPSKTADIEQSLVLGAHGPKTLTVFLV